MENSRIKSNRNLYRLIFLLLSVLLALALCGCRSLQSMERVITKTDTIYKNVNVLDDKYTAHADTIHDSVYVHEVVNEQGETKYKERVVYRDRVGKTIVKTNTIHDTIQVVKHDLSQSVAEKKRYKPPILIPILANILFLTLMGVGAYLINKRKP